MKNYFGVALLVIAILVTGWGCKKDTPNPEMAQSRYTVTIVTAPGNQTVESNVTAGELLPLTDVMEKLGIHVTTDLRETEVVTSLNDILATASKSWNLYINAQRKTFAALKDITVTPDDLVEWRYEEHLVTHQ